MIQVLCAICKKADARWKCMTCDALATCSSETCFMKHAAGCPPSLEFGDATTVQLLEAALKKEPWRSCSCPSAVDRCGSCRRHDEFREKIEAALKAAREFKG